MLAGARCLFFLRFVLAVRAAVAAVVGVGAAILVAAAILLALCGRRLVLPPPLAQSPASPLRRRVGGGDGAVASAITERNRRLCAAGDSGLLVLPLFCVALQFPQ